MLDSVIGSDLFSQDEYIKQYLLDTDIPFITAVKIGLRYYITPELIVQLSDFKNYLKTFNLCLFLEVFGKPKSNL